MSADEPTPTQPPAHIRTRLDAWIAHSSNVIAWLVFIAMAISVFEVIMRYIFDSPTSWVHETTVMLIAVIFTLGGPVALARDKHIRVRLIYDWVSPRTRRWLDVFNSAVILLFGVGFSYAAWTMVSNAFFNPAGQWQLERSGTSWNPPFPALTKFFILLAVTLMTVQALLHLIQTLRTPASPATLEISPEEEL